MNTEQTLVIVGAGAAGLTAGCYARMSGYPTVIVDMAATPGGLCTSWRRKGYLFDGSVAGLAGSAPGNPLYRLWQDVGVAAYCPLHYGENFGRIRLADGRVITIYTDIDRLESHLLAHFPAQSATVLEFTGALRSVLGVDMPLSGLQGWQALKQGVQTFVQTLPHLPALVKYSAMTVRQLAEKSSDPALACVLNNLAHFGGTDAPLLTVLLPLAYAHRKMAGIPQKGWLSFARAMERRFIELGGAVQYQSRVTRLVVENGAVAGVTLADGAHLPAGRVLWAADGRYLQSLLLGCGESDTRRPLRPEELSDQPVQVNIGAAEDFSAEDGPMTYILPEGFSAAGRTHHRMTVHNKYYDPDAAPPGKSAVTVFLDSDYAWWKEAAADPARYAAEKQRCADSVIAVIEQFRPGFRQRVEVVDVSTPLTRERYTGNWMGAMQARKANASMIKTLLQGSPQYADRQIKGLYRAGQWVEAWGGITTAAQSGRKAVQALCRADGKPFAGG